MMYRLHLTDDDMSNIQFVGDHYGWSDAILKLALSEGDNPLSETDAWELQDACESDIAGGHDYFPMLNPSSDLAEKLTNLLLSII